MIFSRIQALNAADNVANMFDTITNSVDAHNRIFDESPLPEQYIGDVETHHERAILAGDTTNFLVVASYDLAREKAFSLRRPRSPIEIAVTEYGGFGENDANVDFFIASNSLKGNDILVIPAGRTVVVYV